MHRKTICAAMWLQLVLAPAIYCVTSSPALRAAEGAKPVTGRSITPAAQRSIERGIDWLIAAMRKDGGLGTDLNEPIDYSCTAITGLVYLAEGNTPIAGPHCDELRRVLDCVLNIVERLPFDDLDSRPYSLVRRKIGTNADLFLCTLFLSQVLGESGDYEDEVRTALERLVVVICNSQGEDGTWGDESWAPVLGTVLGWECLRASSSAGMKVDASAVAAGEALRKKLREKNAKTGDWMHDFYKHASSVRVLYSLNFRDDPVFKECVRRIIDFGTKDARPFAQAGGEEYLSFFLVTECLLQNPEPSWTVWYPTVRDRLMRIQNGDGSWTGHHCIKDRTFCTAGAVLTLLAPNLAMPTSSL